MLRGPGPDKPLHPVVWVGATSSSVELQVLEASGSPHSAWVRGINRLTALSVLCALATASLLVITHSFGLPSYFRLEPCPEGWMYSRRQCFFFSEVQKSWASSQEFCVSHGASLVVITNEDLLKFIGSRMGTPSSWVGLRKTDSVLTWVNGATDTGAVVEASVEGGCAYMHSNTISLSRCDRPRNWICTKEPFL